MKTKKKKSDNDIPSNCRNERTKKPRGKSKRGGLESHLDSLAEIDTEIVPMTDKLAKIDEEFDKMIDDADEDTAMVRFDINNNQVLTIIHMRFIEYFALGMTMLKAGRLAGVTSTKDEEMTDWNLQKKLSKIVKSDEGKKYFLKLQEEYKQGHLITKDTIVKELLARLPEADNKDAIALSTVLNRMHGWNMEPESTAPQINITWGTDPILEQRKQDAEEDNQNTIIDIDVEDIGYGDTDGT